MPDERPLTEGKGEGMCQSSRECFVRGKMGRKSIGGTRARDEENIANTLNIHIEQGRYILRSKRVLHEARQTLRCIT